MRLGLDFVALAAAIGLVFFVLGLLGTRKTADLLFRRRRDPPPAPIRDPAHELAVVDPRPYPADPTLPAPTFYPSAPNPSESPVTSPRETPALPVVRQRTTRVAVRNRENGRFALPALAERFPSKYRPVEVKIGRRSE